jgi:PrtD family type I secretion system ABC transporter
MPFFSFSSRSKGRPAAPTALNRALQTTRPALATAVVFSFFINVLGLAGPLYMMQVYDRVLLSRNITTLVLLTLIIAFLYLIWAVLESLRSRLLVRAGVQFDEEINEHAFDAVQRASLRHPSPSQTQALRDIDTVREFFTGAGLIALCDVPWVPIYIAFAAMLHPWYGILAVASCVVSGLLALANDRATRSALDEATNASIVANTHAVTTFRNVEVLQAMGMAPNLRARWVQNHSGVLGWQARALDRAGFLIAATRFNRTFVQSFVLGLGAYLAIEREITPGTMIAASIIVGRGIQPIEIAIGNWRMVVNMRSAFDRVQNLFRTFPPAGARVRLPAPLGDIAVENLIVHAPGRDLPVLRGVSLNLPAGSVLGVVGPSAAGKSSLARVLVGVWPPTTGSVRLDGSDLIHWDPEQLGRSLGYLPQDVELFPGTIAENIGRFSQDDVEMVKSAQMAGVHEMIQHLPGGYNTQVGEGGHFLSGGQRQRIGLARAIYGMPAVVVLDEPNANLDAAGEQSLLDTIQRLKVSGRTVVLISHKMNGLSLCDFLLFLHEGCVQLFGTRDDVLARLKRPQTARHAEGPTSQFEQQPSTSPFSLHPRPRPEASSEKSNSAAERPTAKVQKARRHSRS